MTTSTAPSVINPNILLPSRPDVLAPPGDCSLFSDNTTKFSIHAHSLPITMTSSNNDKSKFDMPVRQPFPDGDAAAIKSSLSRFHAAAYLRDVPIVFKEKFTTNRAMYDEVDRTLSRYFSYGFRAHCEGSGNNKRILVFFFAQVDHSTCV
ncbi:hypothetical protein RhiirC2_788699 [Rhizophagus irregularis]|uniref:Uncharacterized protein n=1 Tax=Rhizophagus irregularis TaxID=588596 RepID=A0A2N1MPL5_9GLOM|nr:hypothetical protein RhiirC2_788699 [Rhizophagus irregularis]